MDTFDTTAVAAWMQLGDRAEDLAGLPEVVAAVVSFVDALPDAPRVEVITAGEVVAGAGWGAQTRLAAFMLAARLHRRRATPGGVEAFGELGATYVSRYDPDVARMLRIDGFVRPQVG